MESSIVEFHQYFYIPEIQKLTFNLPHVSIIVMFHSVNTRQEAFKYRSYFQYVLFHWDYEERIVAIFAHLIQSE